MASNERRGWPGMLASIDCMHWNWKNCLKAWQGMYCGKSRDATIVLGFMPGTLIRGFMDLALLFWYAGHSQ